MENAVETLRWLHSLSTKSLVMLFDNQEYLSSVESALLENELEDRGIVFPAEES